MPYARIAPEAPAAGPFAPGERLPISVSISHAEGHALCAAAPSEAADGSLRTLGIDLGLVEPRSRELIATFFTPEERRFVRDAPPWELDLRANLVWCAKEAVLKALGVGLTVDTLHVSCAAGDARADPAEWPLSPAADGWRSFVATCSPAIVPGGGTIRGVWRSLPGFVAALASRREEGRLQLLRAHLAPVAREGVEPDPGLGRGRPRRPGPSGGLHRTARAEIAGEARREGE